MVLSLLLGLAPSPPALAAGEIHSYAQVLDDGTLRIRGQRLRLYGIHIPTTGNTCRTFLRPVRCGSRAALALDFRKGSRFVRCAPRWRNRDGSLTAVCRVEGEDLAAYLLSRGWALARPGAPFSYRALERIARHRNLGVWGTHVDVIRRAP